MFFGLTNRPATFQTMMDDIFEDLISEGVSWSIWTTSSSSQRPLKSTGRSPAAFWSCWRSINKLYLCPDKCDFEKTMIEYLGVIISHNSIAMDLVKIAGITKWPALMNKKEVQSFLGFTNLYQQFIRDFLEHTCPLFNLTQNDSGWRWGKPKRTAFAGLKGSVTSAPVLISPNLTKPFHIEADSSDFATGAVLSQISSEDENWHPVAFLWCCTIPSNAAAA